MLKLVRALHSLLNLILDASLLYMKVNWNLMSFFFSQNITFEFSAVHCGDFNGQSQLVSQERGNSSKC